MAMGGHPGAGTVEGIENVYVFRNRVIREERYKLFVGPDRQPEKLVDVIADPAEKNNLMDNPEYASVVARLLKAVGGMPTKDEDPKYERIDGYPAYKKAKKPSQVHKKTGKKK